MKAAPITKKPSFPLMKQGDIQNIYHLQMPRWLFTDPRYIGLSLEAKVTYTFLLNRFQLSRLNGWLNDDGEVFIIYTRRSLSSEMQVSYHKIIEAMKELSSAGLIWERRCGRGDANQIYLALVEHRETAGGSAPFVPPEHEAAGGEQPVPAGGSALETGPSGKGRTPPEPHEAQAPPASPRSAGSELLVPAQPEQRGTAAGLEVPGPNFLKSQSGTSRDSETELPEVDQRDSSYIDLNHTDGIHTEFSLSCPSGAETGWTDWGHGGETCPSRNSLRRFWRTVPCGSLTRKRQRCLKMPLSGCFIPRNIGSGRLSCPRPMCAPACGIWTAPSSSPWRGSSGKTSAMSRTRPPIPWRSFLTPSANRKAIFCLTPISTA